MLAEQLGPGSAELEANMNAGKLAIHDNTRWDPATWPAEAAGWGATEAPRGALGHWVRIKDGQDRELPGRGRDGLERLAA